MTTALLITTYNWPEALNLVLKSVSEQVLMPQEIIIADDGSAEPTENIISKYIDQGLPIKHIWQEDRGFRRTSILNKAIAACNSDYIIQVDGDCILHPNFVEDHCKYAGKGNFLFGSRVNIQENALPEIFDDEKTDFSFLSSKISKRTRNIHLPVLKFLYKESPLLSKKVRGCNLSYWRSDFVSINGYNEDMTGWGKEDSEMVVRLLNNGIMGKRIRYAGIVYHIWHPENARDKEVVNTSIQKRAIEKKLKRCKNGIDQYLVFSPESA